MFIKEWIPLKKHTSKLVKRLWIGSGTTLDRDNISWRRKVLTQFYICQDTSYLQSIKRHSLFNKWLIEHRIPYRNPSKNAF